MENIILIGILALLIGGATYYIIKQKKKGVKCIGCSAGANCTTCKCSNPNNHTP